MTVARELRDPEAARDWLAAGLTLVRVGEVGASVIHEATPWLRATAADAPGLPPPGIIADVGRMLIHPGARARLHAGGPLARVLRPYEDGVVGRIAVDPLRESASDAIRALPEPLRPVAVGLFVERVLARVGFTKATAIEPGALRDLDRVPPQEWVVRGAAAVHGPWADWLAEAYTELVACFQRTGRPIMPGDVAVLEQLAVLRLRSERLALRQVVDAASALVQGLPRRMKPSRHRTGHVATRLGDESAYPVGGFSAIANRGAMENLVTSELALMEDGPEIDLFDVRYAEGELLYYTRDETAFVRERRQITLVLDGSLDALRFRDPGLPYQRLVLVLGVVRALIEQLVTWLSRSELSIRVALPPEALEEEVRILGLAIAEWREAGLAEITRLTRDDLVAHLSADARRGPTDAIWFGAEATAIPEIPHCLDTVFTTSASPRVRGPFGAEYAVPDDPWAAWRHVVQKLLGDLV